MNALQLHRYTLKQVIKNKNLDPKERAKLALGINYTKPDGSKESLFDRYRETSKFADELAEKNRQWKKYEQSVWFKKGYIYLKFRLKKLIKRIWSTIQKKILRICSILSKVIHLKSKQSVG